MPISLALLGLCCCWAFLWLWRVGATLWLQRLGLSFQWLLLLQSRGSVLGLQWSWCVGLVVADPRLGSCGTWA